MTARRAAMALFVAAATLASPSSHAQSATERMIGKWLLRCETPARGATRCRMLQTVGLKPRGQRVMTIVVTRGAEGAPPVAHFTVPLGVYLPFGLALQVDEGETVTVPFEQCTGLGCMTRMQLTDAVLERLRSGSAAKYVFQNAERKDVAITATLEGFASAFAELK